MWQGSIELLMPGRRSEIRNRDCDRRRSRRKAASATTASVSLSSRSISGQLRELQLLSRRLRQGDTVQLPEQKATLRKGRVEPLRQLRSDQPSPRKRTRHRTLNNLETRQLPAAADAASQGIEIYIEFLVARPKPRRHRPQPSSRSVEPLSRTQRHLSVRTQFPLPLTDKQPDRVTAPTPTVSLRHSEAGSFANSQSLKQLRRERRQFLEATLVPVKAGSPQRTRDSLQTLCCLADNAPSLINTETPSGAESRERIVELTSESPASEETHKAEVNSYSEQPPKTATAAAATRRSIRVAHCLTEPDWPMGTAEVARLPQLCQARCHQGQRPVISRAILGAGLASQFATQHRPWMQALPGALRDLRPPQPSQLLCQPLQWANARLPAVAEAAASALPRAVIELNSCSLHQFAGLPGSAARRWASHRLLLRPTGSARIGATCRLATKAFAIAKRFGSAPPVFAAFNEPQVSEDASAFAAVGRRFCYAASHCLRLSVRSVTEPGARHLRPLSTDGQHSGELAIASASAAETIRFGGVFINILEQEFETEKLPVDSRAARSAGDIGGDVGGFDGSNAALNDASGDRRLISTGRQQQGNNSNVNDSDSQGTSGTSATSGCWDYVYLKSEKEEMRLVELHDTQERCSTVSTVMGLVGFKAPIFLGVPTHLLPARAIPVICGNVIELGDWDVNCSEPMMHTAELIAPGYAFFEASVCSNYSDEEEVEFRFAIVVPPAGSEGPSNSELFAWEGGFVRRMSDYKMRDGFLLFGRPELLLDPRDLLELTVFPPPRPKPVWPGWLTDLDQAMLRMRLRPPVLEPDWARLLGQPLGVELSAKDATDSTLTPNLRGPLLLEGAQFYSPLPPPPPPPPPPQPLSSSELRTPTPQGADCSCSSDDSDDGSGINWVRLARADNARVEFVQQVPLGAPVTCRFLLRFHDIDTNNCDRGSCVEASALLQLTVDMASQEEQTIRCNLMLTATSERIGELTVDISIAHCLQNGPLDAARFMDRCGAVAPLQDPAPILILPLPAEWLLPMGPDTWSAATAAFAAAAPTSRYFELPIGVSQSGVLRLLRTDGARGGGQAEDLCLAFPPDARLVVRAVLDDPTQVNTGADALLASLLPASERCALLASHDLQLCLALSLKQARLPLAYLAASVAEAAAALDTCRHFGVHAVAAPAAQLLSDRPEGRALAEAAEVRGVALYAYGGGSGGQAAAFLLEGVFDAGTVLTSAH